MSKLTKELEKIGTDFFTTDEISRILGMSSEVARVTCARAVAAGDLVRIKNGMYVLSSYRRLFEKKDFFYLSNLIQTPSYISLLTALSFYEISSQVSAGVYEALSPVRKSGYSLDGNEFRYLQIAEKYYFGFVREENFFIAEPEKALIDVAHLVSFGRYAIDTDALDMRKLNFDKIEKILEKYPVRTKSLLYSWRNRYERT